MSVTPQFTMTPLFAPRTQWFDLRQRLETENVDPQLSSPFYNGRIPAEIRSLIFEFAVTESVHPDAQVIKPDSWVRQSHDPAPIPEAPESSTTDHVARISKWTADLLRSSLPPAYRHGHPSETRRPEHGFDWLRFDNTEPMRLETSLLMTCRRVYIETWSLPLLQTEQRFYCRRGPGADKGERSNIKRFITDRLSNPAPMSGLKQKDLVRSVRLFTQQFWLEDTFLQLASTPAWFTNLEHLQITLRRADWWEWEREETLRINPFRGNCFYKHTVDLMRRDMSTETGNIEFAGAAWGRAFSHMPKLKSLTIDFETAEDKRDEMEEIVAWALKWQFPLSDGRHLSTDGRPASKLSWRGLPHHWSNQCASCHNLVHNIVQGNGCNKCSEAKQLVGWGYGPQLLVWTCLWKPVQNHEPKDR
ncbi:hypothetical protein F4860DRAFT_467212 [Xylaria cubensis]|nr:hypothetical protein F4860DRAFT_467212 [Xylaria cubensis]